MAYSCSGMTDLERLSEDYERVEAAIRYLERNFLEQPSLAEIAHGVHLSEYHFQRLFSRWVGISPKRFLQYLTKEHAKALIENSHSVLDAALDSGLSGSGRLHDLFVNCEAVTPGEYKRRGEGLHIDFGFHPSPFGECLVAVTERGLCYLDFVRDGNRERVIERLRTQWLKAAVAHAPERTRAPAAAIFDFAPDRKPAPLHLHIRGSNFQLKVWEALLKIPMGRAVTYEDIARHIGHPGAARAVGSACGRNPLPFLIPCHRVLRKLGEFGHYGRGVARKKAMLGWESARAAARR